jgi:hypothetical protein
LPYFSIAISGDFWVTAMIRLRYRQKIELPDTKLQQRGFGSGVKMFRCVPAAKNYPARRQEPIQQAGQAKYREWQAIRRELVPSADSTVRHVSRRSQDLHILGCPFEKQAIRGNRDIFESRASGYLRPQSVSLIY